MTPIHTQRIVHPAAWTARELRDQEPLRLRLSAAELDAFDDLLERTRHLAPQATTRADFDHPVVNALMDRARNVIMNGRGVVLFTGVTPLRYSEEAFQRIYWGLGTHLGTGAVQSALGDRLGYVQNNPDDTVQRGYRSLRELHMHSDSYELLGLMCVRKAKSGGLSGLVSSLAIHNEILATRPEQLAPLYRGFRLASEEARRSSKAVSDDPMPIYCAVDGVVSCSYEPSHIRNATAVLGQPLPDDLAEALACMDELANRDDMALRFLLEPGEMMIWHNYTALHSRTAFEDAPEHRRLLLRLWLSVPDGRKYDPAFHIRAQTYERIYRERRQAAV